MTRAEVMRWVCCACVLTPFIVPPASAQAPTPDGHGFIVAEPEAMVPIEGSRSVRLLGATGEPGMYVMRITFAAGSGTKPHFHDQARYITVIEGTWWVALGPEASTYDPDKMRPLKPGSFIYEPPNGVHYDEARDEDVTVQITGVGPVKTTRLEQ